MSKRISERKIFTEEHIRNMCKAQQKRRKRDGYIISPVSKTRKFNGKSELKFY